MTAALGALVAGSCAVLLALRSPASRAGGWPGAAAGPAGRLPGVPVVATGLAAAATGAALVRPQHLAVAGVLLVATLAGVRLLARHRADREAGRVRSRVVELCDALRAELAAGQTPAVALRRASEGWPALEPATRAAEVGGDVPGTLRELAVRPGAGDLRVVAAAWQVAHRTGHGLGDAVARVAAELRDAEQTRRVVAGELASARATARLVAGLPVAALLMGSGAGADPWGFLVGSPLGLACLAGGLAFGLAGLAWIEALARDVERGR